MTTKLLTIFISLLFNCAIGYAQIPIIPKPNEIKLDSGQFNFSKGLDIKIARGDNATQVLQKDLIAFVKEKKINIVPFSATFISLNLLKANVVSIPNDGYFLSISPNQIHITATTNVGLFYGIQSLKQLMHFNVSKKINCVSIKDIPAFSYRGFHIDVAHRNLTISTIKRYIDAMALLKLNQLHLQFTDEHSWHLQLKQTNIDGIAEQAYSMAAMQEVVQYANERFINIIPEINLAIPSFLNDSNFAQQKKCLDEITSLFQGKYIHLNFYKNYKKEIEQYLISKNKIGIERDVNVLNNGIYQAYNSKKNASTLAQLGKSIIQSPKNYCSLDFQQYWDDEKKALYMTYLPLDKAYAFNPISKIKEAPIKAKIIGAQACAPTQFIKDSTELEYMVFPRLVALAECMWTAAPQKKFKDFETRLKQLKNYFFKETEIIYDIVHINPNKAKKKKTED